MDTRIALKNETVLRFRANNGMFEYTIQNERARGGSSIVYNAFYTDNIGVEKLVLIKECYPFKLEISRSNTGNLVPTESDMEKFEQAKEKMREAYKIGNELFKTDGLTNSIDTTYDLYNSNNTVYFVSAYSQGTVLSYGAINNSLEDRISIVRSVAIIIQKIHNKGYLYLDIKPDNIFTFNETTDIVRFFDFDTLIPIDITEQNKSDFDYRISYTKGFAPLEQREGNKKKIGKYSDVYGVGALLFYLIFNRIPNALDCDYDADYDFSSLTKFSVEKYQDTLFFKLKEFFHHTLAHYYLDRFQDMEEVIEKLDELKSLSDTNIPFIYSSRISEPVFIVGREKESDYLTEWFAQNIQNCLFIVGMGGIGKSTLMHSFLARNIKNFDTIIYVNYNMSIVRTITDDIQIRISNIEQDEHESSNEYFTRKLEAIRKLAIGKNIVLIIDNYTGESVQDFSDILNVNWKIVLITRNKSLAEGYKILEMGAIQNNETLYSLFENYLGRYLSKNEYLYLDNVIEKVSGHTLILELIAKQITKSYITLAEASSLVDQYGFSNIASEKVDYMKDDVIYHETIKNIIHNLYDIAHLSEIKKTMLKIISLFGINGVDIKVFTDMLQLSSKDDINELISESWINIDDMHISMHPVIIETMQQYDLSENSKKATVLVMNFLYKKFKLEAKREEYPRILLEELPRMKMLREPIDEKILKLLILLKNYKRSRLSHFLTKILKYIVVKYLYLFTPGNDIIKEIVLDRISRDIVEMTTNHKEVALCLQLSECFLKGCKNEKNICELEEYKRLMYQAILNMPREKDDFVLNKSKELIKSSYFQNRNKINEMMELFDRIVSIYEEKRDFPSAYDKIMEAKILVKKYQDNFILGRYYYLLAQYYDVTIDEHYYILKIDEDKKYYRDLIHNLNKAIRYMKKSRDGRYLGEYYCFKALVLIKRLSGNPEKIKKLLNKAEILIKENEQAQSRRVRDYNMTCAYYCAYIEHDFIKVDDYISEAYGITHNISQTDFNKINEMISIIRIYFDWDKYEDAISWIKLSIKLCNNHKNVLAYLRKKIELLKIWLDISYKKQDFEMCKVIIKGIEEDAVMVGVNMEQIVPGSLQKEIYSK